MEEMMRRTTGQRPEADRLPLIHPGMSDGSALVAIIRRLAVAGSVEEITDIATHAARSLLQADGITFVLRDGDLCHYVDEDAISPLWKGKRFPATSCISGWCMIERRPAVIPEITDDPRIPQEAYRATFVRSLAMTPVRQDRPMAAMGAYWRRRHDAAPVEVELLQTVADCAALALANVELEQKRDKEHKARLELNHRLRNVIQVVGALARQTARNVDDLADFDEAFAGRLQSLARAQTLLTESESAEADLKALIRGQAILGSAEDRFLCRGPDVRLGSEAAFHLGLVLHELSTNARKYGALTNAAGTVSIEWGVVAENHRPVLELSWTEAGGPPVHPPTRTGFGSALLQQGSGTIEGRPRMRFDPAGVVYELRVILG